MATVITGQVRAEDGSKLWLRYARMRQAPVDGAVVERTSPTGKAIRRELQLALPKLTVANDSAGRRSLIIRRSSESDVRRLGEEGFAIRTRTIDAKPCIAIESAGDVGALYGTFHFLRLLATDRDVSKLNVAQRPALQLRLLDHWDNLDGSIERGYAGKSLWKWDELPDKLDPRYIDYARANASIGINGAVLNNVNANPLSLSSDYLKKAAALAEAWRSYGIRVYLSANFAAPKTLGKLPTADPLDPRVAQWWREKADEIYKLIPDFGGFVVKANSEGQPGPQDYRRTHADGANVLADAVAPHGGVVMWRAFVYDQGVDPDRAKRAYLEFTRLDGQFRPNVIVQVKNGPIDFQPREPFHPLFGAMKHTNVMAELQVTQEYLGHSNHLVFLAPMWKEFLDADTFAAGKGSTVARVIEGKIHPYRPTGICAVANTGSDVNWCGHHFAQANWYAFGRLAWDPNLSSEQVADEWLRMTFGNDRELLGVLKPMMLDSWETFVGYSMPLGLHHLISGDHYAPDPANAKEPREDWTAVYYHRADAKAIGFDRTTRGDRAVEQYFPKVRDQFDDSETCPQSLLLWFHRLPWTRRMKSGRTLWEELCLKYSDGAARAAGMVESWRNLSGKIDEQRYREVAAKLETQALDAAAWRSRCLTYFASINGLALPADLQKSPSIAPGD